ncbi:MAG: TRL-like family protein [Planctomycetota bacterium]
MKKCLTLLCLVATFPFLAGCMSASTAQVSAPVMQSNDAGRVGDQSISANKTGMATAKGIVLFYFGDNSIDTAMKNGNISRIHHVDYKTLNVLGVYVKRTTIVHGE